jgi:hypothetical protein
VIFCCLSLIVVEPFAALLTVGSMTAVLLTAVLLRVPSHPSDAKVLVASIASVPYGFLCL